MTDEAIHDAIQEIYSARKTMNEALKALLALEEILVPKDLDTF